MCFTQNMFSIYIEFKSQKQQWIGVTEEGRPAANEIGPPLKWHTLIFFYFFIIFLYQFIQIINNQYN